MSNKNTNTTAIREEDPTLVNVLAGAGEDGGTGSNQSPLSSNAVETKPSDAAATAAVEHIPLIKTDTALMSLRASNFDTPTAVGEPVDNAIQAGANNINIRLIEGQQKLGKKAKATLVVEQIAVADDGAGMTPDVLERSLVLGYSSRYDNRKGMGRFGVGSTLAGISQAKRLELYTRTTTDGPHLYSYIDLEEIESGKQQNMPRPTAKPIPKEFADMMGIGSGTLVVWSKCDRLVQGEDGTVHDFSSVGDQLRTWISRTYRYFIDGGLQIELDDQLLEPHDPLFMMDVPRFPDDEKAEVLLEETIPWPIPSDPSRTSDIQVRLTLLPPKWRRKRGWGNQNHPHTRERRIHENEGFSILRSNREIFYGTSFKFYSSAVEEIDRWHGIEIKFNPELDECFRVRNVKKGAEPVDNLRAKLIAILGPPIKVARRRIKDTYKDTDNKEKATQGIHEEAENIGASVDNTSPKARSGQNRTDEEREEKLTEAAEAAAEATTDDGSPTGGDVDAIKDRLKTLPISIVDSQWHGKEFIDIDHLGSNVIVRLNNKHPFFTDIYGPVLKASGAFTRDGETEKPLTEDELLEIVRSVHTGLDLLIMAYAKAESMEEDAEEKFSELRTYWGLFLSKYVEQRRGRS